MNKHCLEDFRAHWECLDNNNHQLWQCRPAEWRLNRCVFHNLVSLIPFASFHIYAAILTDSATRNSKRPSPTQEAKSPCTCGPNRSSHTDPSRPSGSSTRNPPTRSPPTWSPPKSHRETLRMILCDLDDGRDWTCRLASDLPTDVKQRREQHLYCRRDDYKRRIFKPHA